MIGRGSLDSQYGRPSHYAANVGYSNFRYSKNELRDHSNQRHQQRKWTWEDNKHALYCYFRSNPTQREYRKRIVVDDNEERLVF